MRVDEGFYEIHLPLKKIQVGIRIRHSEVRFRGRVVDFSHFILSCVAMSNTGK